MVLPDSFRRDDAQVRKGFNEYTLRELQQKEEAILSRVNGDESRLNRDEKRTLKKIRNHIALRANQILTQDLEQDQVCRVISNFPSYHPEVGKLFEGLIDRNVVVVRPDGKRVKGTLSRVIPNNSYATIVLRNPNPSGETIFTVRQGWKVEVLKEETPKPAEAPKSAEPEKPAEIVLESPFTEGQFDEFFEGMIPGTLITIETANSKYTAEFVNIMADGIFTLRREGGGQFAFAHYQIGTAYMKLTRRGKPAQQVVAPKPPREVRPSSPAEQIHQKPPRMETLTHNFNEKMLESFFHDSNKGDEFTYEIPGKMHPVRVTLGKVIDGTYHLIRSDKKGPQIEISMRIAHKAPFRLTRLIHPISENPKEKYEEILRTPFESDQLTKALDTAKINDQFVIKRHEQPQAEHIVLINKIPGAYVFTIRNSSKNLTITRNYPKHEHFILYRVEKMAG